MSEKFETGTSGAQSHTFPSSYQTQQLISVSIQAPEILPRDFLAYAAGKPRFFWQDAAADISNGRLPLILAGFGIAANLTAWGPNRFEAIQAQAAALFADAHLTNAAQPEAAPRLFGGFSFRDDFAPDNTWSIYRPAQFVLPHIQLAQNKSGSWLTINALLGEDEHLEDTISALHDALESQRHVLAAMTKDNQNTAVSSPAQIRYPMPFETWQSILNQALNQMDTTDLNKVVLSRICEVKFEQNIPIDNMLANLRATYPDCYCFLFEPRPGHAFIGATPELLARVNGRFLNTMGLAGTVARGQTDAEAEAYAQELLSSAKDQHEHALVVESLRRRLAPMATSLTMPAEPDVLRLSTIQHLYTPISAVLKSESGILPMIKQLHPTPALGGSPRDLAMQFIKDFEPVPRGWYAAPIGTINFRLDGAFGVAIRSAAVQDRRAWLYAGAGIVPTSDPLLEWEETELKFSPIMNALRIDNR